jgi:Cactus-binding C-terminus of cactin protein/Conserved mid region of cactin
MKVLCRDRLDKIEANVRAPRGVKSINADVDRMFSTKSLDELGKLERQIRGKLDSEEDIDVDYWEHLLKTLLVWKAKAKLKKLSEQVIADKLQNFHKEQTEIAAQFQTRLRPMQVAYSGPMYDDASLDPEPSLKLKDEYKKYRSVQEEEFLDSVVQERSKILKLGFIPMSKASETVSAPGKVVIQTGADDSTSDLYERERARGFNEDEEVFAGEESVVTASTAQWSSKHRPRKPKYFNRVQMGYDWNKYNQTHYDHDNPPPKVVQGYKFNVFYPDLIDKTKAPTYKIEREGGRRRGQTLAPAGEEDNCLIRFMAGPPYEDIAFRIVDREWDFSSKRERGFKSSFENVR